MIGNRLDALRSYEAILEDDPCDAVARVGFALCLNRSPSLALRLHRSQLLREALTWEQVDPQLLAVPAARRLHAEADEPLLITLLRQAIVVDPALECDLTAQRRAWCLDPPRVPPAVAEALAVQGRLNEYAWVVADDEARRLAYAPAWIRAMYGPAVEEANVESEIPKLTGVAPTSAQVRQQYAAHPYPRWNRLTLVSPAPLDQHLNAMVGTGWQAPESLGQPEILVAGCGTGQNLLDAARLWSPRTVTGVDLSRPSLAYTASMAQRYDVPVELLEADLLMLDDWDRRFDAILCTGVLHHLEDPLQGWRTLRGLLRPGGVMLIGLYSQTAREGILAAQREVRGHRPDLQGIREARAHLNALPPGHRSKDCQLLLDFFYSSGCRDLLFHVRERQFTIADIGQALAELDLTLLDFEVAPAVRQVYGRLFGPGASLACWDALERMYPRTFLGMYQFWCQKSP